MLTASEKFALVSPQVRQALARQTGMLVYVVSEGSSGPCKIGFADKLNHRLSNLQNGNPRRLRLEFAMECENYRKAEKIAHHRAGYAKQLAGEWFDIPAEQAINAVKQACYLATKALERLHKGESHSSVSAQS